MKKLKIAAIGTEHRHIFGQLNRLAKLVVKGISDERLSMPST